MPAHPIEYAISGSSGRGIVSPIGLLARCRTSWRHALAKLLARASRLVNRLSRRRARAGIRRIGFAVAIGVEAREPEGHRPRVVNHPEQRGCLFLTVLLALCGEPSNLRDRADLQNVVDYETPAEGVASPPVAGDGEARCGGADLKGESCSALIRAGDELRVEGRCEVEAPKVLRETVEENGNPVVVVR